MVEFGTEKRGCYLCGNDELVKFCEHYYFCPNCSCIYTYMIVQRANCSHIKDTMAIPTVIREPWYNVMKDKVYIKDGQQQTCSICGAECLSLDLNILPHK